MADVNKTCDVFISHSASDAGLAAELANAFRENGLATITNTDLLPISNPGDTLWEALAESRALLTILSPSGPTPLMGIELGAARAWNKPIFGVVADPTITRLPPGWTGIHLYPASRIEDVIRSIKLSGKELTDEDRTLLVKLYAEVGVSVDQLALEPSHLEELVRRFSADTGKAVPGERLLSELLRVRKQDRLPRLRASGQSKPHRGTA